MHKERNRPFSSLKVSMAMNPRPLITIMPHLPSIRTSGQAIRLLPTPHPSLALVRVLIYVMLQDPRGYHHHVNPSIWAHCHRPENYPTSGFPPKTLFPNTHTCTHAQSCLTLCNPMDCSPSGSPIHGILQARILEWVPIPFSRESSRPRIKPWSPALQADSLLFELQKSPLFWTGISQSS